MGTSDLTWEGVVERGVGEGRKAAKLLDHFLKELHGTSNLQGNRLQEQKNKKKKGRYRIKKEVIPARGGERRRVRNAFPSRWRRENKDSGRIRATIDGQERRARREIRSDHLYSDSIKVEKGTTKERKEERT